MKHIFESKFYTIYQSPNADELIEKIDTYTEEHIDNDHFTWGEHCLLYTSPSPRDGLLSRMPSSA